MRTTVTAAETTVAIKPMSTAPALSEAGFSNRLSNALRPLADKPQVRHQMVRCSINSSKVDKRATAMNNCVHREFTGRGSPWRIGRPTELPAKPRILDPSQSVDLVGFDLQSVNLPP